MNIPIFESALICYCISTINGIVELFKTTRFTSRAVVISAIIGFILHSLYIIVHYIQEGHLPIVSFHEAISFLAWSIVLIFFFLQYRYKPGLLGSFIMPIVFILMFSASTLPRQIQPLSPQLKSYWFGIHIFLAFLGDAAFALSCGVGIMYLIQEKNVKSKNLGGLFRRLPNLQLLDELNYRLISIGFPLLSLAIISGVLWAESATGLLWRWDPKEVWSLITWLLYALVIHLRLTTGWRGKKAAMLSVVGFIIIIITFFSIHLFHKGFHQGNFQGF
jgi:cytochrome c-type biogenesis protein CcsB